MKMDDLTQLNTIDLHAAGEPCRVIYDAFTEIPGATMAERLRYFKTELDELRSFVMCEPRGHKDMFGSILLPPLSPDADAGIIYMNSDGYLDMCIHGTICSARAMLELGRPLKDPNKVVFDAVCGRIEAVFNRDAEGNLENITVQNVPSFVYTPEPLLLTVDGIQIKTHIVFAGNFFAVAEYPFDEPLNTRTHHGAFLVSLGIKLRDAANAAVKVHHPCNPSTQTVALSVMYQSRGENPLHMKNVVVFADGQMDRSPCGSGTSALMTFFHAEGRLPIGAPYTSQSIIDSFFHGVLKGETKVGPYDAVIPCVTGEAYLMGRNTFYRDPKDPFKNGFLVFQGEK